jgi:peptide/nickel transport system substrate-binding protein
MAYALNKQEILDGFYGSVGTVATDFLPDSLAWARPPAEGQFPAFDAEKAKSLLAEAGYPNGFSTMVLTDGKEVPLEFWYMPVSRPYFGTPKPIAEAFAAQLADIGIKVELKTEDWGAYLDNVDAGKKHGMWMLGWTGDYSDPNNFLFTFFGPNAKDEQGYENKQVIDLLSKAGAATSQDEAAKLFSQAGGLIAQDAARIPIVHAPPVYAAKKALEGWKPSPFGSEPWKDLTIAK